VQQKPARPLIPPAPPAAALLRWYDRHRRKLPWRARPGERADPYGVWLSEIMLQQTTVKAVGPYYARFLTRFPTIERLARADLDDVLRLWAGLGYYARARNLHRCAKDIVERHDGKFPESEQKLRELPGIGPYTAAAIAAIAFNARAAPVDGNVERVVARLYRIEDELPGAKPQIRRFAEMLTPAQRTGDFAQALMDLGATICTPKRPTCARCPWNDCCAAHARGDAETFPRKATKTTGRLRRGAAFVVVRADGCLLVRTRPAKGLLGGMSEVPTSAWTHDFDRTTALDHAPRLRSTRPKWRRIAGAVKHVFTHFPLELTVFATTLAGKPRAPRGMRWVAIDQLSHEALPNVMRKVIAHAGVMQRPSGAGKRRVSTTAS
jgi:A/G-specific adenine glycosylase